MQTIAALIQLTKWTEASMGVGVGVGVGVDFGCRSFRFHATHEEALVTLEAEAYEQWCRA